VTEVVSEKSTAIVNILFDKGAQDSFISQQLANVLLLTPSRQENITVASFGADTMTPQSLNVKLIAKSGQLIPSSVMIVPKITGPLRIASCVKLNKLPYLYGVTLAHPITGRKNF